MASLFPPSSMKCLAQPLLALESALFFLITLARPLQDISYRHPYTPKQFCRTETSLITTSETNDNIRTPYSHQGNGELLAIGSDISLLDFLYTYIIADIILTHNNFITFLYEACYMERLLRMGTMSYTFLKCVLTTSLNK